MNIIRKTSVFAVALLLCIGTAAHAANPDGLPDVLAPAGTNFLNSNPLGVDEQFAFTGSFSTVASSLLVPFAGTTFNGTLSSWVIAGDAHNPLGGLDFVWEFTNI